jgi:hypothetical protein
MTAHRRPVRRTVSGLVLSLCLASCSMATLLGSGKDTLKIAGGCPDVSKMDSIAKIDFADEFSVNAVVGAQLKAGVIASTALKAMAAGVDADLKAGCGGLAKDLGAPGEFKTGTEACHAAIKAIGDSRAKMGANVEVALDAKEPTCSMSIDVLADCMSKCDASLKGAKPALNCEGGDLSGKCDADCTGKCDMSVPASCSGTCDGSCDAEFSGSCSGSCDGSCDGKQRPATPCSGQCAGRCNAKGKGTCSGNCAGTCELSAAATCAGTCTGNCSVAFKEPVCSGTLVTPNVSADCKASCDAQAGAQLTCTPATIAVKITGSRDAQEAARFAAALENNLPRIMKVAKGLVPKLGSVVGDATTVIQAGIAAGQAATKGRATATAHVGQCLVTPFTSAIEAVANVKATISVSLDVNASATASGSAPTAGNTG